MIYLELARRQRGFSQSDLGNHPKVRIARTFIGMIERGIVTNPDPDQLLRLSRVLGLPPKQLLEEVPDAKAVAAPAEVEDAEAAARG